MQDTMGIIVLVVEVLLALTPTQVVSSWLPKTAQDGHTGKIGSLATVVPPGFIKVEGAMIPHFCKARESPVPTSTAEVAFIIKHMQGKCEAAGGKRLSIRATRQLYHSSSDILCPDASAACSVVISMDRMNKVYKLDKAAQTVTVGAGLGFNVLLVYLQQASYTLNSENLPYYGNLTVGGIFLTGAHGSSLVRPSAFGQLVTAATYVDALGHVHAVQGREAQELTGTLGLLGIVTEVTVKVKRYMKQFALVQRRPDKFIIHEIRAILRDPIVTVVQWLPDVHEVIILRRKDVSPKIPGHGAFELFLNNPLLASIGVPSIQIQQLDDALLSNAAGPLDDLPICIAESLLIPFYRDERTKLPIPDGMPVVGDLPVMTASECRQTTAVQAPGGIGGQGLPDFGCFWRSIPITLLELDFALADLQSWIEDVRLIYQKEVTTCVPSVIEFAMRFGKASDLPLDMAYQRDTVYIDVVLNKGPHLVDEPSAYQHVFDEVEQLTVCKYKARAHWGKNSNRAFAGPPDCPTLYDKYPGLKPLLKRAKVHDPEGIFVPPVLQQALEQQTPRTKGCAVRSECYCQSDLDCGWPETKHACVQGSVFKQYRVCKSISSIKHDLVEGALHPLTNAAIKKHAQG